MSQSSWVLAVAAVALFASCRTAPVTGGGGTPVSSPSTETAAPQPPIAEARPHRLEMHGDVRVDDYYWLRQRENPEVIEYLEAENAYAEAWLSRTSSLQETIFEEIVGRIPQRDESVPVFENGWFWATRYEPGKEYAIYTRQRTLDAPEEIVLDVNDMAKGHGYYAVRGVAPSDSGNLLAFAVDTVGRRKYDVYFKDLRTGAISPERLEDVTGNSVWAADEKTVFYVRQDPQTLRAYQVWRHEVGSDPSNDVLVYQEDDEEFSVYAYRSKSDEYIMIASSQTMADEARFVPANDPTAPPRVIEPRKRGREYGADHLNGAFTIRTNDGGTNFRIMRAPDTAPGYENWTEVVPHRDDVYIGDFELFRDRLVLSERKDGLTRIHVLPWEGGEGYLVDFGEPAYVAWLDDNPEPDTMTLRFGYSSLTTPRSIYDWDMVAKEKVLRKQEQIGGGFDPANYVTERLWATARDGVKVPVSVVYRKGLEKNGTAPLLLYGYGSYGYSTDPGFNAPAISLLDRGFVYALAHIRGGQELGRQWYEHGKLLEKKNTFTDFIDAAEFLIEKDYADPERVFAMGGSAGGLLVGAVMNMRPDLWKGIVARVPFVDVVTTMLDESIPLTTSEYDEWGNPNEKEYYEYMLSYSPYDQVQRAAYPNLLITTGLHDSQVQYWEPAKWLAKLRTMNEGDSVLLMKTDMEAGHSGTTGRFKRHHETAMIYGFLLELANQ